MSEKLEPGWPTLTVTRYGFQYGSAVIERVLSDERLGIVIRVSSALDSKKYVDVRVSPAGRVVEAC
jgi:hypothetical protein